jgi:TetR/AcrR family transcriptional regulator
LTREILREGKLIANTKAKIRELNSAAIIAAAEEVFALKGFKGATTQEIADLAGLPKANVHYYFKTKKDLYNKVLEDVVVVWKNEADAFNHAEDPAAAISDYIRSKMEYSFTRPFGSKVWANEIIHGAPVLGDEKLARFLSIWEKRKTIQINRWAKQGKIIPVDPHYLLFMIWATTQHYADFEHQIRVLNGNKSLTKKQQKKATDTVIGIILRGIGLEPAGG